MNLEKKDIYYNILIRALVPSASGIRGYSGDYFVTICIHNRQCLFGQVINKRTGQYSERTNLPNQSVIGVQGNFKYYNATLVKPIYSCQITQTIPTEAKLIRVKL